MNRRKIFEFCICVTAIWHGFAIIAQPFSSLNYFVPLRTFVQQYSNFVGMYPSWGFFTQISEYNIELKYQIDARPEQINFFSKGETIGSLLRFHRCGACGNAAYQFYFRNEPKNFPWMAGKLICDLHPEAKMIVLIGLKSPYSIDQFEEFKKEDVTCDR